MNPLLPPGARGDRKKCCVRAPGPPVFTLLNDSAHFEVPRSILSKARGLRAEPEAAKPRDERQEQGLVAPIVGNVQKGVVGRISLSDQSASACCGPPRCVPSLGAALTAVRLLAESRSPTAAVAFQVLGHHRPKFSVSLWGDPEHAGCCRGRRVGGGDHRARSQRHGPTLRSEGFSCQRARKDTAQLARRKRA